MRKRQRQRGPSPRFRDSLARRLTRLSLNSMLCVTLSSVACAQGLFGIPASAEVIGKGDTEIRLRVIDPMSRDVGLIVQRVPSGGRVELAARATPANWTLTPLQPATLYDITLVPVGASVERLAIQEWTTIAGLDPGDEGDKEVLRAIPRPFLTAVIPSVEALAPGAQALYWDVTVEGFKAMRTTEIDADIQRLLEQRRLVRSGGR